MAKENKKKTFKLKNLSIKKVDLVHDGANPDAFVNLFKSKGFISKSAKSFNEQLSEKEMHEIFDQIWQFTSALTSSFVDILHDNEAKDKLTLMNKSLDEFYAAAGLAVEAWSKGKLSDYRVSDTETPEQTVEIVKSIILKNVADGLPENLGKAVESKIKKGIGEGVDDMKFDKSKLTPEEIEMLENMHKKAGLPDENEEDENEENEEKNKKNKKNPKDNVQKGTGNGSDNDGDGAGSGEGEDIYKGLHPAVKAELVALRKFQAEQEDKELYDVAKKYEPIGKKPEELVPLLKSVKAAGGSAYSDMIAVLDTSLDTFNKSTAFKEIGSNGHSDSGASVIAKAKAIADDIKKNNPDMSDVQAMAKAWETNPDLMAEYDEEIGG